MENKKFHEFLLNEYSNHLRMQSKNYYNSTKYYIKLIISHSENIYINDVDFTYCSDLIVRFKSLKKSTNRLIILLKSVLHFAYDLKLHFHIFRHTCAAIMREQDFSIEMISKKLHHANISTTTMYYLHDTEEKIKKDLKRFAEMQILK